MVKKYIYLPNKFDRNRWYNFNSERGEDLGVMAMQCYSTFPNTPGLNDGLLSHPEHFLYLFRGHIYPTPPLGQDMTQGQFF